MLGAGVVIVGNTVRIAFLTQKRVSMLYRKKLGVLILKTIGQNGAFVTTLLHLVTYVTLVGSTRAKHMDRRFFDRV